MDELGVKSGYIIFREGTEPISDLVLSSDNGGYSHVGMLYKNKNSWQVIHATPKEKDEDKDGVVIHDFEFYIDKNRSKRYAIYKVLTDEVKYKKAIEYMLLHVGYPFHYKEDTGTYCTLLLYRAWQNAGILFDDVEFRYIDISFLRGKYLFPKEFRASKYLKLIYMNR